jgi:hypothetical protein
MFKKPNRQFVGKANGLTVADPIQGGREIISALLNNEADREEKRRAVQELKIALDSLAFDLEC